jgi:hypothetical protein
MRMRLQFQTQTIQTIQTIQVSKVIFSNARIAADTGAPKTNSFLNAFYY